MQGPALMQRMAEHAERFNTEMVFDHIHYRRPGQASVPPQGRFTASTPADALIITTGATAKYLGIASEEKFKGKGVSACATCDGFFFRDQDVAVIGGGNTAVEEALYLSNICRKVILVHRRDKLRAEKIMQDKLFEKAEAGKIELVWNHTVDEVLGDDSGVTGVRVKDVNSDATRDFEVTGFFVAIGHTPNTGIFESQLDMRDGYITDQDRSRRHGHDDLGAWCLRRRRRGRSCLSPGGHLGRLRLHGGTRRRTLAGSADPGELKRLLPRPADTPCAVVTSQCRLGRYARPPTQGFGHEP